MINKYSAKSIEKQLEIPLLIGAVATIPSTVIELLHLGKTWSIIAYTVDWAVWALFLAEVVIMLLVVDSKTKWIQHHCLNILIIVLTPPIFSVFIQPIRLLRLLRTARILKLKPAFNFLMSREGLHYVVFVTALIAVSGGFAFSQVENISFGNGIYWAITTMCTVGYGDIAPHTTAGKVIAVVMMLVGIGTTSIIVGAIARIFVTHNSRRDITSNESELTREIQELSSRVTQLQEIIERKRSTIFLEEDN